ncbi:MAG: hypothetical protein V4724_39805 [Pseudomonadota bacterium]
MRHFAVFCVMTLTTYAFADEVARSVDASQFEVAGIKLGMSPAEAVAAVSSKLRIDKRSVKFDPYPAVNQITNSRQPQYFTATNGSGTITVHLIPRVPPSQSQPILVGHVRYEMPWTPDNARSMKASALEKYGQPSNGLISARSDWCLQPDKNLGIGCGEFRGATLKISGVTLDLEDPSYQHAVIDYLNKINSTKPAF